MSGRTRFMMAAIAAVALWCGASAQAATMLLSVDFEGGANRVTEDDFDAFVVSNNTTDNTNNYGSLSVTVADKSVSFARGAIPPNANTIVDNPPNFTYAELYRDYFGRNDDQAAVITIAGLAPTTRYVLQLFSYDHGDSAATLPAVGTNTTTFAPNTLEGTTGTTGTVTWTTNATPTTNGQYSTTLLLTSNGDGELSVLASAVRVPMESDSSTDARLRVNGFILSVPEPTSMVLLGLGSLCLATRPRRVVRR